MPHPTGGQRHIDVQFCLRFGAFEVDVPQHAPVGAAVQDQPVLVLFLFAFFTLVVGMPLTVVDVVAHLTQGFVVAEKILNVDVISRHSFNLFRENAVHGTCLCANAGCFCVSFLARHKRHGQTNAGRRLKNKVGFHLK